MQVGHVTPVDELEAAYQGLQDWQQLRKAVADGAEGKAEQLFWMEVRNAYIPFPEAKEKAGQFEFDDAQQAEVDQLLTNLEFRDVLSATPRDDKASGGEKLVAIKAAEEAE